MEVYVPLFLHFLPFLLTCCAVDIGGLVCRMDVNEGHLCTNPPYSAFYFHFDSRHCVSFTFLGCGGNQNRWMTKEECEQGCQSMSRCPAGLPLMDAAGTLKKCHGDAVPCPATHLCRGGVCCPKPASVCSSPVDGGHPCGTPPTTRYFFDSSSSTCRPFAFTRCGGNANNFASKGACSAFCSPRGEWVVGGKEGGGVICKRGDPYPEAHSSNGIMTCRLPSDCPSNYTCTLHGQNRGACCPSLDHICSAPVISAAHCVNSLPSTWTFARNKGICEQVHHRVCADQLNSFPNQEQCMELCIGTCPRGIAYINPLTLHPQLCSVQGEGCPSGHECLQSAPFARICCRSEFSCPRGDEGGERCSERGECPRGFHCHHWPHGESVCCPQEECPVGLLALGRDCTRDVPGACPPDHLCLRAVKGGRDVCCAPSQFCEQRSVDRLNRHGHRCLPGDSRCPEGTLCLASKRNTSAIDITFHCCIHDTPPSWSIPTDLA